MKIEYKYYKDKGYLIVAPEGTASLKDVLEYTERLYNDDSIAEPFYEIVNFIDIDNFDFGYYESNELINSFLKLKEKKQYKGSCLIAEKDLAKGMSHIFKVIGDDLGIEILLFKTIDDAIEHVTTVSS